MEKIILIIQILKEIIQMTKNNSQSKINNQDILETKSDIEHSLMLENAIQINSRYLTRTLQKENHILYLLFNESPQIFSLLQLIIIILLAYGFLTLQSIQKNYMLLSQQLFVLQVSIIILMTVKVTCLFVLLLSQQQQNFIYKVSSELLSNLRILTNLFIPLYSILLIRNSWWADFVFIVLSLYATIQNFLFGNFLQRKCINYCLSLRNSVISKVLCYANIYLNSYFMCQKNLATSVSIVALAILYFIWFTKHGYLTYFDKKIKAVRSLYTSLYISLVSEFFILLIDSKRYPIQSIILELGISFVVISIFLNISLSQDQFNLDFDYRTFKLLQLKLLNVENTELSKLRVFYHGFISLHEQTNCKNVNCYSNLKQIYDAESNHHYPYLKKTEAIQLRLKLIVKCCYESLEQKYPGNPSLLLNFLQFAYNELKNQWTVFRLYRKFSQCNLNFVQKIQMETIFLLMKHEKQNLNQKIYQSSMEIESILQAEDTFIQILELIQQYFLTRLQIINYLKSNKIQVEKIDEEATSSYQLLDKINDKWKLLEKHRKINKKWEYFHLICHLFLNNRMLDKMMMQTLKKQQTGDELQSKPILMYQQDKLENEQTLFHFQSFYIHASTEKDHIIIKKISEHAEDYLGYHHNQLIGSNIERLMPKVVKEAHFQKMKEWFERGFSCNEYRYSIKFTKLACKSGDQIDIVKYFKVILNQTGAMEFICLIKVNNQQPNEHIMENEKQLKKSFYFSSYLNSFNEIDPERLAIFSQLNAPNSNKDQNKKPASSSQSINRKNQSNIFLKNDNVVIIQKYFERLLIVKKLIRLFFVSVALFMLATAQYTNNKLAATKLYSSHYLNYMTVYRLPILLNINYIKTLFNIGNQTLVKNQIKSQTLQYISLLNKDTTLNTVYDQILNKQQYFSPIPAGDFNKNISYDQIDLFFQIASSISILPINHTTPTFQKLNSYLFPCYSTLMNNTKYSFHDNFQILFANSKSIQIMILVSFIGFTIAFFGFTLYQLRRSFKTLGCVSKIMTEMPSNYLLQMDIYEGFLFRSFQKFTAAYRNQHSCQTLDSIFLKLFEKNNLKHVTSLNKYNKKVIENQKLAKFRSKSYLFFILACIICLTLYVISKVLTVHNLSDLAQFQIDGFSFLRYYPTAPIVGMGVFDKFLTLNYPKQMSFFPLKYKDGLLDMASFGQVAYMSQNVPQTLFYQKRRNYFFANPCQYNPSVLVSVGINVSQCQAVYNMTYKRGLVSYFRIAHAIGDQYINKNRTLSISQITEYALGISVTSGYILDAIGTWSEEFNQNVDYFKTNTLLLGFFCFFIALVMHIVFFQLSLFGKMQRYYQFQKKTFNHFIPQNMLIKEKIVYQHFVNSGLIVK